MKKAAFTLVELLVVIGIIGALASLLVPNFMAARERARDAQRKSDLRQLQKALELYKQDQTNSQYPATDSFLANPGYCWSSGGTGSSCPAGTVYMSKVPGDPKTSTPTQYYYARNGSDPQQYNLCACLENKADADATSGNCSGSYTCTSGKYILVSQP